MSDKREGGGTVFRPASPLQSRRQREAPPQQDQGWDARPSPPPEEPLMDAPVAPPPPSGPAFAAGLAPSKLAEDDVPLPATPRSVRNLLVTEAAPVLALGAGIGSGRVQMPMPQFHRKASEAILAFDRAIAPHYSPEQRRNALYGVCATIDDIAQNLPNRTTDAAIWAQRSMVVRFFDENIGGDRFWQRVDELLRLPGENLDLIELYHACLAAGFEGRFRREPDGRRRLQEMMGRLYAAIEHVRSLSPLELVPQWKGEKAPAGRPAFWNMIALAAAGGVAVLLLVYLAFLLILMATGDAPTRAMADMLPDDPLSLSRSAPPLPVADSGQKQALEGFLAEEIRRHEVAVVEDGQTVRVRTTIGELFRSASEQLEPGREPLFVKIGQAIEKEPGPVLIEGHADSDRITTSFPDNKALSEARAGTIAGIIREQLSDPGRVATEGKGSDQPLASNETPDGKAQNRRVEIIVQRRN